jgi:RNA polymerase sigma factor (TIGR02999 family)
MSLGHARLELHRTRRLAVIDRPLAAPGDAFLDFRPGKLPQLQAEICEPDRTPTVASISEAAEGVISSMRFPPSQAEKANSIAVRARQRQAVILRTARGQGALIPSVRRGETSRDCAIWTRLGGRQKLTNCNSSCEKEPVGLMSGRNERMSSEEKPADCVASPVSPNAEEATAASKTLEAMLSLVYEELRLLAGGYMRRERPEHTLQRTALVHEAYLRLAAQRDVSWENPAHFLAIFARLMRQTLTNHAVARSRAKRGGSDPTALILEFYDRRQIDVAAVDEALRELEALDARQARIVELRFFGGLKVEEIAKLLEISPATVKREWAVAKLWLRQTLSQGE